MIDIKILRTNPELIRDSIVKRNLKIDLDSIIALDAQRMREQQDLDLLRTRRNEISSLMGKWKPELTILEEAKSLKEKIQSLETTFTETEEEYKLMLASLPNFLDPTAAIGPDDSGNVVEKTVGTPRVFDFPIKAHYEIGESRWWIDIEKWAEVSGARFWYLKWDLVLLQFAIMNYVMNEMVQKWFIPVIPPYLVREPAMYGTGFFPADRSQIYSVNPGEDDLFLIGTSEVPLTSYHGWEVIDVENTVKYVWYSACFRREAGTYGKDMKWILRGHQFDKIEMVCFCKPEESSKVHNEMVEFEEYIWNSLGIPYHKLNVCSGDLGNPAMKKYDLEAWMPAQNQYREVTSCSNIWQFQSRRLGIKYRKEDGNLEYVHTLNGTVIAFSRCLIAIMENYQNEDMTVTIPEVLRNYMGGKEKI
jgi:seryl-tRNA synthetase